MIDSDGQPLFSIITVSRNAASTIGGLLTSVATQTFRSFEHIVIDGASSDGTAEIIRSKSSGLAYWCSEPDRGIADAMNKGLKQARGKHILILHADDYFFDCKSLAMASKYLSDGIDIHAFDLLFGDDETLVRRSPKRSSWRILFKTCFLHQATFCRRDLFERIGGFDPDYKIAMDYEFFLRAAQNGATVSYVPEVLSVMRNTGISSQKDWPTLRQRFLEERQVHRQRCDSSKMRLVYALYWMLYFPYRRIRALV